MNFSIPNFDPGPATDDLQEPKERRFVARRCPGTARARTAVHKAKELVEEVERRLTLRRNRRRPSDQETFELTIAAVVSDLAYNHLHEDGCGIYITRSKRLLGRSSRYRPRVWSKALPKILDVMATEESGLIHQVLGKASTAVQGKATILTAGPRLLALIDELELEYDDFALEEEQEPVVLKRSKDPSDYWDEGGYEEYEDTEETEQIRGDLREVNLWLAQANLSLVPEAVLQLRRPIDLRDRQLRRIFTQGSFQSGGRLFGGFWQPMSKDERLRFLQVEGEAIEELDYGQAGSRIVYGMAKAEPPSADHYAIPPFVDHRDGIKRMMSAMLFSDDKLSRFPKHTRRLFSKATQVAEVIAAVEDHHQAIKDWFYVGIGHKAQHIESKIMVEVLLTLKEEGIVALPIHDAILVGASAKPRSAEVMASVFHKHTGVQALVS